MYAMCGKLIAKPGQREKMVEILLRAAQTVGQIPSCRLYAVNEDLADDVTIWVMEIWNNKEAHDDSLKNEQVRALIAEAMPLMGGAPSGSELALIGGHGV